MFEAPQFKIEDTKVTDTSIEITFSFYNLKNRYMKQMYSYNKNTKYWNITLVEPAFTSVIGMRPISLYSKIHELAQSPNLELLYGNKG